MSPANRGVIFPYAIALRGDGGVHVVPVAAVDIKATSGAWIGFSLIIDSGASVSVLPKQDAALLGVRLPSGTTTMVQGVGGRPLHGWERMCFIRLGNDSFQCPFVFLESERAPRILGRQGIFDRYAIVFEEYARRTVFIPRRTARSALSPIVKEIS